MVSVHQHPQRSGRYIRYVEGQEEFYDTTRDPHEWTNAIDDVEYASVIERMIAASPNPSDADLPMPEVLKNIQEQISQENV